MKYAIDKNLRPVYLQIYKFIRDDITEGAFRFNTKLPSKRVLAEECGVSVITVEHAYALLCEEGYAESRERSGFYVIFKKNDGFAAHLPHYDNNCYGNNDYNTIGNNLQYFKQNETKDLKESDYPGFSVLILNKAMRKVMADYQELILEKSQNKGCIELRKAIRRYLARNKDIKVCEEQIIVGAGAEYLYRLIIELLGRDKTYAIEKPSYSKLERIYRAAGVYCELLPLLNDGIDSEALFKSTADVLHTTPYRSYPSGVTASASKRHEYIMWASKTKNKRFSKETFAEKQLSCGKFIIESDYGSEFAVSSKPMETLFALSDADNVIYMNTFSRTISSSLRVGYMVLPEKLVKAFDEKLGFYSCTVSTFEQLVLTELIESGDFERHINRIRKIMRKNLQK